MCRRVGSKDHHRHTRLSGASEVFRQRLEFKPFKTNANQSPFVGMLNVPSPIRLIYGLFLTRQDVIFGPSRKSSEGNWKGPLSELLKDILDAHRRSCRKSEESGLKEPISARHKGNLSSSAGMLFFVCKGKC